MICKPKTEGGLGVLNLKTQNQAYLLKNWQKFFNKPNVPWVSLVWENPYTNGKLPSHVMKGSFWWRDVLSMLINFKGIASINVLNGQSCYFWNGLLNGRILG